MRRPLRLTVAVLVAAASTVAVAALSRLPHTPEGPDALLRLSWRTRAERVEECRTPSAAELEALPVHMRRPTICEGRILPYHLRVQLGGRVVVDDTIHPTGARADRPLYVLREFAVAPGPHRISVRFVRDDAAGPATAPATQGGSTSPPPRLALDAALDVRPGEIVLVTVDPDTRDLVVRRPAADAPAPAGAARAPAHPSHQGAR